jgi:hypothetical protein
MVGVKDRQLFEICHLASSFRLKFRRLKNDPVTLVRYYLPWRGGVLSVVAL